MNEVTEQEIIDFIEKEFWESNLNSNSDIFKEVGIDGSDCDEFLQKYSEKYSVDMNDFLWYFHYQDEASLTSFNIGGSLFKSPNQSVTMIPITPKMLTEFANSKKWKIDYPDHKLPKYRYDIIVNQIILISFIALMIYYYFIK